MPPKSDIDLRFPVAGVDRSTAVQNQPPFTTTDALNVRPRDVTDKRERGGSRPGLETALFLENPDGTTSPKFHGRFSLLDSMDAVNPGITNIEDRFTTSVVGNEFSSEWTKFGILKPGITQVGEQIYATTIQDVGTVGLTHSRVVYDVAEDATLSIRIMPFILPFAFGKGVVLSPGTYSLFLGANNANGGVTNGILAQMTIVAADGITGLHYTSKITTFINGLSAPSTGASGDIVTTNPRNLRIKKIGDNEISFSFGAIRLASQVVTSAIFSEQNQRWGFAMQPAQEPQIAKLQISVVTFEFSSPSIVDDSGDHKKVVVAIADTGNGYKGRFYRQNTANTMVEVTDESSEGDIAGRGPHVTDFFQGVQLFGKYFVAQFGSPNVSFPFRPLVYDSATDILSTWVAVRGDVPANNPIIARYLGRIVLAGSPVYEWYMSRRGTFESNGVLAEAGDAFDWLPTFDLGDENRPIFGNNSDAGNLPEPITALIPHSDDFLIFGGTSSMWLMRGDPAAGGRLDNLDAHDGVLSRFAWARGPDGSTIYLGRDGLYVISPGGQSFPQNVSINRLPNDLRRIDPLQYEVFLAYDVFYAGIHIYLTPRIDGGTRRIHWWFDWKAQSFWPMKIPDGFEPGGAVYHHDSISTNAGILLGGIDGGLRRFDDNHLDDGEPINSHVLYGPIMLSGASARDGLLMELHAAMSADSMDVTWSVYVGKTAEEAKARALVGPSASFEEGTWRAGLNHVNRPRGRGQYAYVRIDGESSTWAIEHIRLKRAQLGKLRA